LVVIPRLAGLFARSVNVGALQDEARRHADHEQRGRGVGEDDEQEIVSHCVPPTDLAVALWPPVCGAAAADGVLDFGIATCRRYAWMANDSSGVRKTVEVDSGSRRMQGRLRNNVRARS